MKTTDLNKSLRLYRLASRLSVAEVSSKSGVPAKTIKRLEAGDIRWANLNQLRRIANALSLRVTIEVVGVER